MLDQHIVKLTEDWIRSFIIPLNICPFAKREFDKGSIKIDVINAPTIQEALEEIFIALVFLDKTPEVETSLLVFPSLFKDFLDYLDFVDYAESLLDEEEYEGVYQLATFHPDYCFADTAPNDVTNYTNRSPYPMLHLLREKSVEKAIKHYGDTTKIPEDNMNTMRKLGLENIKKRLAALKPNEPGDK